MDGLCSGCFTTHFPKPNMKSCKAGLQVSFFRPYRLRGGADAEHTQEGIAKTLQNLDESISPMIKKAVENAQFHGINLYQGVKNLANGDCIFESVIDSINTRACFEETLNGTPQDLRRTWMSEVEQIAFQDWSGHKCPNENGKKGLKF